MILRFTELEHLNMKCAFLSEIAKTYSFLTLFLTTENSDDMKRERRERGGGGAAVLLSYLSNPRNTDFCPFLSYLISQPVSVLTPAGIARCGGCSVDTAFRQANPPTPATL